MAVKRLKAESKAAAADNGADYRYDDVAVAVADEACLMPRFVGLND